MTIKQQGGIFGRNPTFNNVEVDGTLTANSVSAGQFNTSIDVNGSVTSNGFIVDTASTANLATYTYTSVDRSKIEGQQVGGAGGKLDFKTNDGGGLKSRVNIDHVGDVVFYKTDGTTPGMTYDASAFALAFASGGGIDFSATSGTGTSELFDDYEEGTWTPVWQASTTNPTLTYTNQLGYYTKIGNVVYLSCFLRTDAVSAAGTGNARIGGLPYTCANDSGKRGSVSIGNITNIGGNLAAGYAQANGTYLNMTAALGGSSNWNISNLAGNQLLQFSAVYMTA